MPNKIDDLLNKAGDKIDDTLKKENMDKVTDSFKSAATKAENVSNDILGDFAKAIDSAIDKITDKINGKK